MDPHEVQGNVIRTYCEHYSALYWFNAPPYLTINIESNSMKVHSMYVTGVTSSTGCGSLTLGGKLGNSHYFIYQVERTVATLLTD